MRISVWCDTNPQNSSGDLSSSFDRPLVRSWQCAGAVSHGAWCARFSSKLRFFPFSEDAALAFWRRSPMSTAKMRRKREQSTRTREHCNCGTITSQKPLANEAKHPRAFENRREMQPATRTLKNTDSENSLAQPPLHSPDEVLHRAASGDMLPRPHAMAKAGDGHLVPQRCPSRCRRRQRPGSSSEHSRKRSEPSNRLTRTGSTKKRPLHNPKRTFCNRVRPRRTRRKTNRRRRSTRNTKSKKKKKKEKEEREKKRGRRRRRSKGKRHKKRKRDQEEHSATHKPHRPRRQKKERRNQSAAH